MALLKWATLLLLFLSQANFGLASSKVLQSSYYLYDGKPLNLSDNRFKRYVVPQLRAMGREYYHILEKLHPLHQSLIPLKGHLTEIRGLMADLQNTCLQSNPLPPNCTHALNQMQKRSRQLDGAILGLYHHPQMDFSRLRNQREINALTSLLHSLDRMASANYRFGHALNPFLFTSSAHAPPFASQHQGLAHLVHQMAAHGEMIQTQLLESKLKQNFDFVWRQFFLPVEKHILKEGDAAFILRSLEPLNIAWNTFHMKITTESHKLPSGVISITKIMHNRWNSVLKIILNN